MACQKRNHQLFTADSAQSDHETSHCKRPTVRAAEYRHTLRGPYLVLNLPAGSSTSAGIEIAPIQPILSDLQALGTLSHFVATIEPFNTISVLLLHSSA
jgi:hypothetical protein